MEWSNGWTGVNLHQVDCLWTEKRGAVSAWHMHGVWNYSGKINSTNQKGSKRFQSLACASLRDLAHTTRGSGVPSLFEPYTHPFTLKRAMHVISLHGADIHMTGLGALRSAAYWTMEVLEDVDRVLRKGLFSLHMY